jgi:hypothetical protein
MYHPGDSAEGIAIPSRCLAAPLLIDAGANGHRELVFDTYATLLCSASAETRRPATPTTPCPRVGWALYALGNEHLKSGAAWLLKSDWDPA